MFILTPALKQFRLSLIKASHQKYLRTQVRRIGNVTRVSIKSQESPWEPQTRPPKKSSELTPEEKEFCGII